MRARSCGPWGSPEDFEAIRKAFGPARRRIYKEFKGFIRNLKNFEWFLSRAEGQREFWRESQPARVSKPFAFPLIFLFHKFHGFPIISKAQTTPVFWQKYNPIGIQSQINVSVKGRSYFENGTQLLMIWKDILLYRWIYHIVLQIGDKGEKVVGAKWCVHNPYRNPKKLFISTGHPPSPKKLLPLASSLWCSRNWR